MTTWAGLTVFVCLNENPILGPLSLIDVMIYFQEVDKLFHDCDINSNDILDKMEIARLNLHFLFKIPRLGNQLMGKS